MHMYTNISILPVNSPSNKQNLLLCDIFSHISVAEHESQNWRIFISNSFFLNKNLCIPYWTWNKSPAADPTHLLATTQVVFCNELVLSQLWRTGKGEKSQHPLEYSSGCWKSTFFYGRSFVETDCCHMTDRN